MRPLLTATLSILAFTAPLQSDSNSAPTREATPVAPASVDADSPAYTQMHDFMQAYREQVDEQWSDVVCRSGAASSKNDPQLRAFVINAVREQYNRSHPDAQIDIFFFKGSLIRSGLPRGDITLHDIATAMPTDYTLVTFETSGEALQPLLRFILESDGYYIYSGLSFTGDQQPLIAHEPLQPGKTYRVATNDYHATGLLPILDQYPGKQDTGILIRDLITGHCRWLAARGETILSD